MLMLQGGNSKVIKSSPINLYSKEYQSNKFLKKKPISRELGNLGNDISLFSIQGGKKTDLSPNFMVNEPKTRFFNKDRSFSQKNSCIPSSSELGEQIDKRTNIKKQTRDLIDKVRIFY